MKVVYWNTTCENFRWPGLSVPSRWRQLLSFCPPWLSMMRAGWSIQILIWQSQFDEVNIKSCHFKDLEKRNNHHLLDSWLRHKLQDSHLVEPKSFPSTPCKWVEFVLRAIQILLTAPPNSYIYFRWEISWGRRERRQTCCAATPPWPWSWSWRMQWASLPSLPMIRLQHCFSQGIWLNSGDCLWGHC